MSDPSFGIEQKFHCPLSQDIKVHGDAMSDPADPQKKPWAPPLTKMEDSLHPTAGMDCTEKEDCYLRCEG